MQNAICFCNNVSGLFHSIGIPCILSEWRLSLTVHQRVSRQFYSIMAINTHLFLLLIQSILKETYKNVKTVLNVLKYDQYNWEVIGDFKIITFLMGMQGGFTKYPCYLCPWYSRGTKTHYQKQVWSKREEFVDGENNVKNIPLINQKKFCCRPFTLNFVQ